MPANQPTTWDNLKTDLQRIPWLNYLLCMFAPLVIMEISSMLGAQMTGVYIALAWLVLAGIIFYLVAHVVNPFAIMTFLVTLTRFIGGYLQHQVPAFILTTSVDNTIIGLIFIGSMLRPRPFIMSLLDKQTIQNTEARFGKSKFWFKAWFDINIVWGLFYIVQGIIVSYATALRVETGNMLDFIFGWPSVLVLLYFSVSYPRRYWTKHGAQMQEEIEAAKEYEASKAQVSSL
jgi:hypothetical protein